MKRAVLTAVLAAACGVVGAQEDTNLYYKVFTSIRYDGFPPETGINRDVWEMGDFRCVCGICRQGIEGAVSTAGF